VEYKLHNNVPSQMSQLYDFFASIYSEKNMLPASDVRFILGLVLSPLAPHSIFVEMLKPQHPEQTPSGLHVPHHHHPRSQHRQHTSELLLSLSFLGEKVSSQSHSEVTFKQMAYVDRPPISQDHPFSQRMLHTESAGPW